MGGMGQAWCDMVLYTFQGLASTSIPWILSLALLIIDICVHRDSSHPWRMAKITGTLLALVFPYLVYCMWMLFFL